MSNTEVHTGDLNRHTEEMQDIITMIPSWIFRWGLGLFFGVMTSIIGLTAFIRYPDIVNASLKITSPHSPKPIVAKMPGKLVKLLVKENESVIAGQPLAYMESTGSHAEVINLSNNLKRLQIILRQEKVLPNLFFNKGDNPQLGELQSFYQTFYQEYLTYCASVYKGFYVRKRAYLNTDLADLIKQEAQLKAEKEVQQEDLKLAEEEYKMHQKLADGHVETIAELRQQESKYLAKKSPLIQTNTLLLTANSSYLAKQKEILELDNQLEEEKSKFSQALNSLISQTDDWINKYVLIASQPGKLTYAGIVQENQVFVANQEMFYINPGNEAFFGEMAITQNNMGRVKEGQKVLIKLKSYPFEEYGILTGRIKYIADVPYKDSIFISKVDLKALKASDIKHIIHLKSGMMADAEVITQEGTILQRISRKIFEIISDN